MKTKTVRICNLLCALLMLALVLCQFLPFWSANGDTASLQGYTWWPDDHKEVTNWFKSAVSPDFRANDVVIPTILMLVFGCLGSVFCLLQTKSCWVGFLPLICGGAGIWGYLTNPAYQMGSLWVGHLILAIAITALSIPMLIACVKTVISWFRG